MINHGFLTEAQTHKLWRKTECIKSQAGSVSACEGLKPCSQQPKTWTIVSKSQQTFNTGHAFDHFATIASCVKTRIRTITMLNVLLSSLQLSVKMTSWRWPVSLAVYYFSMLVLTHSYGKCRRYGGAVPPPPPPPHLGLLKLLFWNIFFDSTQWWKKE